MANDLTHRRGALPAELEAQMAQIAENLSALPIDLQDRIERAFENATTLNREIPSDSDERLVALKNKYDPTNFFRMNHNIKPK
jgi:Berberine and berberine like